MRHRRHASNRARGAGRRFRRRSLPPPAIGAISPFAKIPSCNKNANCEESHPDYFLRQEARHGNAPSGSNRAASVPMHRTELRARAKTTSHSAAEFSIGVPAVRMA